jgi:hypothetical protein
VILNPDAILRGETIDGAIERIVTKVKPPSGAAKGGAKDLVAAGAE